MGILETHLVFPKMFDSLYTMHFSQKSHSFKIVQHQNIYLILQKSLIK